MFFVLPDKHSPLYSGDRWAAGPPLKARKSLFVRESTVFGRETHYPYIDPLFGRWYTFVGRKCQNKKRIDCAQSAGDRL